MGGKKALLCPNGGFKGKTEDVPVPDEERFSVR